MSRSFSTSLVIATALALTGGSTASAQFGFMAGGGSGSSFRTNWPRYREYRDFAGQSYSDTTPTGRRGYFVPLTSPGMDDLGNGPSAALSPIFNAPEPLPHPIPLTGEATPPPAPRPTGFFRRVFRGS